MAIVVNEPTAGGRLGASFGAGLGQGLQTLAEMKLQQYHQKHEAARLEHAPSGINMKPEYARSISNMDPKTRSEFLKSGLPPEFFNMPATQPNANIPSSGIEQLNQGANIAQPNQQTGLQNLLKMSPGQQLNTGMSALQPSNFQQPTQKWTPFAKQLTPAQEMAAFQKEQSMQETKQRRITSDSKGFRAETKKAEVASIDLIADIDAVLDKIKKGKTRSGVAGFLPTWMGGTDTQVTEKYFNDIVKKSAAVMPGVMSRARIQLEQAAKAAQWMTKPAQIEVLNKMKNMVKDSSIAIKQIERDFITANDNKIPEGLDTLVFNEHRRRYPQLYGENQTQPEVKQSGNVQQTTQTPGNIQQEKSFQNPYGSTATQAMGGELFTEPQEEIPVAQLARVGTGVAARVLPQSFTGWPDIAQAGLSVGNYLLGTKGEMPKFVPTSENTTKGISNLTGGYIDPKTPIEEKIYDFASVVGSLFSPAQWANKGAGLVSKALNYMGAPAKLAEKTGKVVKLTAGPFASEVSIGNALKRAAIGEAAGTTVEAFGGDSLAQGLARAGFMTALGTKGGRQLFTENVSSNYNNAKELFHGTTTNVKPIIGQLTALENNLIKTNHPDKEILLEIIRDSKDGLYKFKGKKTVETVVNKLANKVKSKEVATYDAPINDIIQSKQNNNALFERTLFPIAGAKHLPKTARPTVHKIGEILKRPIAKSALANKEAGAYYLAGEEGFKALNESGAITKWLKDNSKNLLGVHGSNTIKHGVFSLMAGTTLGGLAGIGKAWNLVTSSPEARAIYLKLMQAAAKKDSRQFIQNMARLDRLDI